MWQMMIRVALLFLLCSLVSLRMSWAEETPYDRQGDVIPPGAEMWSGVLDRVNVEDQGRINTVIINDTVYRVDENTKVKTAHGALTSLTSLKTGTHLDYYALGDLLTKVMPALTTEESGVVNDADSNRQVESIGTLPPASREAVPVRQEDGVWKN